MEMGTCFPGSLCQLTSMSTSGTCVTCGKSGQPCCEGDVCATGDCRYTGTCP
jgi:hypothetical protein